MKDSDLKKIEDILRGEKLRKVPDEVLSGFTRRVMDRIEGGGGRPPAPRFRFLALVLAVAAGVLAGYFVLGARREPPAPAVAPAPVIAPVRPPAPATPPLRLVQADELTVEEEIRLLEELEGEVNGAADDVMSEEEWLELEMEVSTPSAAS
jgi:hypothetical protein